MMYPFWPPPQNDGISNAQFLEYLLEQEKKREKEKSDKKDEDFIKIPKKKPPSWSTGEVFMVLAAFGWIYGVAVLWLYVEFIKVVAQAIVK
jgi:hypothetical protein